MDRLREGDPAPELCDQDVVIENVAEFPITGPYLGRDGVRQWWDDLAEVVDDMRLDVLTVESVDSEHVVTTQRLTGTFRLTGIAVDTPWGSIISVRDGMVAHARGYGTPMRARRAAGLNETVGESPD